MKTWLNGENLQSGNQKIFIPADGIYKNKPGYGFGVLAPRTCGQCTIDKSLYWKLIVDKDAPNYMKQEEIAKALERIRNEPMSLIIDGDEKTERKRCI